ncbi:YdaS family helix-turn-helix protein [Massilia antarctica]|uniref:YdaS family helix-turn-helix protein n=1 Tax=Massilia antarctica TaxID=2765360 RepID=UPI00226E0C0E|nr:YdaS family helix-turn-helix protein [Massilia sp. H27-R4]MCY0916440.1 YdaS family helix-turn-helix protein [Massilia sp. H27-R4]
MIAESETGIAFVVRLCGTQAALAKLVKLVKLTPQAVQRWMAQGKPSRIGCKLIERALDGKVTRAQLDPDLFGPLSPG